MGMSANGQLDKLFECFYSWSAIEEKQPRQHHGFIQAMNHTCANAPAMSATHQVYIHNGPWKYSPTTLSVQIYLHATHYEDAVIQVWTLPLL